LSSMTEYWKSLDRKFCDACKCWLSDNKASVEFHESGKKHIENVQRRLKEIQKSTRKQEKDDRKVNKTLRKMEEAATAAYMKDKEENPDISLQLTLMQEEIAAKETKGEKQEKEEKEAKLVASFEPKILHREDKSPTKRSRDNAPYTAKGGWTLAAHSLSGEDLELPPKNPPSRFKLSPEKKVMEFKHDSLVKTGTSGISSDTPEVFKKRKICRGNPRQRSEDS